MGNLDITCGLASNYVPHPLPVFPPGYSSIGAAHCGGQIAWKDAADCIWYCRWVECKWTLCFLNVLVSDLHTSCYWCCLCICGGDHPLQFAPVLFYCLCFWPITRLLLTTVLTLIGKIVIKHSWSWVIHKQSINRCPCDIIYSLFYMSLIAFILAHIFDAHTHSGATDWKLCNKRTYVQYFY